jgi:hypothetical protein
LDERLKNNRGGAAAASSASSSSLYNSSTQKSLGGKRFVPPKPAASAPSNVPSFVKSALALGLVSCVTFVPHRRCGLRVRCRKALEPAKEEIEVVRREPLFA